MTGIATGIARLEISLILLAVLCPSTIIAQAAGKDSLVLTGTLQKTSIYCHKGRRPMVRLDISMQFRNDGNKPVILLDPGPFTRTVKFSDSLSANNLASAKNLVYRSYLDDPFGVPGANDYNPEAEYIKNLSMEKVEKSVELSLYRVLEPGSYFEFNDLLLLENGFRFDSKPASERSPGCDEKVTPVPDYSFVTIEYRLSAKKAVIGDRDLFEVLRERWKSRGLLFLDDSGDVLFVSHPILLNTN